jgi:3-deoxy-D-manno-octulosonic-acid transferase
VVATLLRAIYSVVTYVALPLLLLRLWWRGREHPGYRVRIGERLGLIDASCLSRGAVWIHAVSVGETQAAAPIVEGLLDGAAPDRVLLTNTTPTGAEHAKRLFGDRIARTYFPFDTPDAVGRFLDRAQPRALVLIETELWPNLLHACAARDIPVLLVNARLSGRSHRRYARLRPLVSPMLQQVRAAAVQSADDAARLIDLGLRPAAVTVTGSLKFDLAVPSDIEERVASRRADCAAPRPIWIAASTHAGEEASVIAAHRLLLREQPSALLLLAPRHPTRAAEVAALVERVGLSCSRRSRDEVCSPQTGVYLIDTLGELLPFYAVAEVAFVGGSLVDVGGHNLLEPAALARPVLHGPAIYNFAGISRLLGEAGAATTVSDAEELAATLARLMSDSAMRQRQGEAGAAVVRAHAGATRRVLSMIRATIPPAA